MRVCSIFFGKLIVWFSSVNTVDGNIVMHCQTIGHAWREFIIFYNKKLWCSEVSRVVNSSLCSTSPSVLDSLPDGCSITVAVLATTHLYTPPLSNGSNKAPFLLHLFGRAEKCLAESMILLRSWLTFLNHKALRKTKFTSWAVGNNMDPSLSGSDWQGKRERSLVGRQAVCPYLWSSWGTD